MTDQFSLFDHDSDYLESLSTDSIQENNTSFKIHASLIYKLGESLIADEVTALSELIKNSYDADATLCFLKINTSYEEDGQKGRIELSDNGCGMNLNDIVNGWLTLSNSHKKRMKKENKTTPKYKRYPLGDKGLGRLSVQKLGKNMQLITKTLTSETEYTVTVPWGDFLKNTTIDQIPVKINKEEVNNDKSYTKIIITGLINNIIWDKREQVDILTNSISKIVSPFKSKDKSFKVIAEINGQSIEPENKLFDELLSTARATHTITYMSGKAEIVSEYKKTFFYNREILKKIKSGDFSLNEAAIIDFWNSIKNMNYNVCLFQQNGNIFISRDEYLCDDIQFRVENGSMPNNDPGPFECRIYEYSQDEGLIDYQYDNIHYDILIERDEYKGFIKSYYGIKVVRDGFIVQGLGEGESGDWLGLSAVSKSKGYYYDLQNNNVIGCVFLTSEKNSALKETTNREGFVEDSFYKKFWGVLDGSIKRINKTRRGLINAMKAYVSNAELSTDDDVLNYKSTSQMLRENLSSSNTQVKLVQESLETLNKYIPTVVSLSSESSFEAKASFQKDIEDVSKTYSLMINERDTIIQKLDAINYDFEKMSGRLRDLFELAGLGLSVEMFTHEFDATVRNLKLKNQKIVKSGVKFSTDELITHIKYVTGSLDALRKQMSYFNPGLKYVRAERNVFAIREFFDTHKLFYDERCKRKNIMFYLDILADFNVRANRGMLNQVFDNLLGNAEYWLDFSYENNLISKKEYHIEIPEQGIIIIWDNGVGISKDIESRLFEPFESKKQGGRGLGLYITAENLKYSSSRIRLLGERNKTGHLFKFEIDLTQIIHER